MVLESPNPGIVLGVDKRFYCTAQVHSQDEDDGSWTTILPVVVRSPQLDQEWKYEWDRHNWTLRPLSSNPSSNGFVEKTLRVCFLALLTTPTTTTTDNLTKRLTQVVLTLKADNDFYSLVPHLQEQGLPLTLEGAQQLPPFLSAPKSTDGSILKTGLGSSACLVTSLVAALVTSFSTSITTTTTTSNPLDNATTSLIFRLAQICHCHAQGKVGSGFDVAAACYGSHVYQRIPKDRLGPILSLLEEPQEEKRTSQVRDTLQQQLDIASTVWTGGVQAPLYIPPYLQVLLADVSGGSESPSMARTILQWKTQQQQQLPQQGRIPHWHDLADCNLRIGELWQELTALSEPPSTEQIHQLAHTHASDWATMTDEDNSCHPCVKLLSELSTALAQTRHSLQQMGTAAGVPIEPPPQTELANSTMALPGVVAALVPGAGGYDAMACVYIHHDSVRTSIDTLWSQWASTKEQEGGDESTNSRSMICPLTVQAISFGQGLEIITHGDNET